jgi:hypothetical protein
MTERVGSRGGTFWREEFPLMPGVPVTLPHQTLVAARFTQRSVCRGAERSDDCWGRAVLGERLPGKSADQRRTRYRR